MDEKKERTSITLEPEIAAGIREAAAQEKRSISNMIEIILVEWLKANSDKKAA